MRFTAISCRPLGSLLETQSAFKLLDGVLARKTSKAVSENCLARFEAKADFAPIEAPLHCADVAPRRTESPRLSWKSVRVIKQNHFLRLARIPVDLLSARR